MQDFQIFQCLDQLGQLKKIRFRVSSLLMKHEQNFRSLVLAAFTVALKKILSELLTFAVTTGSIDRLMQYDSPEAVFELINPIVALKK